ncbi:sodium:solute symporter family protein [Candidatus Dependentiae bacterium]|nr:sodium:solute symporter family protein [Candidatus Dependentiae bacterium]
MNPIIFFSVLATFIATLIIIGLRAAKQTKTTDDYFLAGRSLSLHQVAFTLIATQLGGNMLIGTSQWSYAYGFYGLLYTLGIAIGFLILASGFAAKLQEGGVGTTAALLEKRYDSLFLKKFASIISIVSLFGILISIVISSRALLISIGMHSEVAFALLWCAIIIYTMIGGLHAVVAADTAQVLFIIGSIGSISLYSFLMRPHRLLSLSELWQSQQLFVKSSQLDISRILATLLMPALFALVEQDLAQRFFAARSPRVALMAALAAGIFIIVFGFVPVYFGMQAKLLALPLPTGANPFLSMIEFITNDFVFACAACGVLAAITSTADSLLCAISSNIAQDFDYEAIGIKRTLVSSQLITLAIGIAAVVGSFAIHQNIIDVAIQSYALSVSCLLVPLLYACYSAQPRANAAIAATCIGGGSFLLFLIYPLALPAALVALPFSLIGYHVCAALAPH